MLEALSMRYGGMLVPAEECNYDSYKHLGLLCPICKRGVYLSAGSQREAHYRKLKDGGVAVVKESTVPAHFSHFPDVSRAEVDDCELRSEKISVIERLAILQKSKQQRLKIMQRHLWKMLSTSTTIGETSAMIFKHFWMACSVENPRKAERRLDYFIEICQELMRSADIKALFADVAQKSVEEFASTGLDGIEDRLSSEEREQFYKWKKSLIDIKMHIAIACEVFDFLCNKMQRPIFSKLLLQHCQGYLLMMVCKMEGIEPNVINGFDLAETLKHEIEARKNSTDLQNLLTRAACTLYNMDASEFMVFVKCIIIWFSQSLTLVSWADEFERLEAQEKERTLAMV